MSQPQPNAYRPALTAGSSDAAPDETPTVLRSQVASNDVNEGETRASGRTDTGATQTDRGTRHTDGAEEAHGRHVTHRRHCERRDERQATQRGRGRGDENTTDAAGT